MTNDHNGYSITYAVCNIGGMIAVSFFAYQSLLKEKKDNPTALQTTTQQLKRWFLLLLAKRAMYFVAIIHVLDTATDIGVLIEWYELGISQKQTDHEDGNSNSNGIDVWLLFLLALSVKLTYHCVSSGYIYYLTHSPYKTLLQLFDVALFEMIWLNWKWELSDACEPQKFIHKIEAIFESFGQALLQFVYLCHFYDYSNNQIFVIISFVFSIISLSQRFVSDDVIFFNPQSRESLFNIDPNMCKIDMSPFWAARIIWRVLEVGVSIVLYGLLWYFVGGLWLSLILLIQLLVLVVINIFYTKRKEFFAEYLIISPIVYANSVHSQNLLNNSRITTIYGYVRLGYTLLILIMSKPLNPNNIKILPICGSILLVIWVIYKLQTYLLIINNCLSDTEPTSQRLDVNAVILSRNVARLDEFIQYGLYFKSRLHNHLYIDTTEYGNSLCYMICHSCIKEELLNKIFLQCKLPINSINVSYGDVFGQVLYFFSKVDDSNNSSNTYTRNFAIDIIQLLLKHEAIVKTSDAFYYLMQNKHFKVGNGNNLQELQLLTDNLSDSDNIQINDGANERECLLEIAFSKKNKTTSSINYDIILWLLNNTNINVMTNLRPNWNPMQRLCEISPLLNSNDKLQLNSNSNDFSRSSNDQIIVYSDNNDNVDEKHNNQINKASTGDEEPQYFTVAKLLIDKGIYCFNTRNNNNNNNDKNNDNNDNNTNSNTNSDSEDFFDDNREIITKNWKRKGMRKWQRGSNDVNDNNNNTDSSSDNNNTFLSLLCLQKTPNIAIIRYIFQTVDIDKLNLRCGKNCTLLEKIIQFCDKYSNWENGIDIIDIILSVDPKLIFNVNFKSNTIASQRNVGILKHFCVNWNKYFGDYKSHLKQYCIIVNQIIPIVLQYQFATTTKLDIKLITNLLDIAKECATSYNYNDCKMLKTSNLLEMAYHHCQNKTNLELIIAKLIHEYHVECGRFINKMVQQYINQSVTSTKQSLNMQFLEWLLKNDTDYTKHTYIITHGIHVQKQQSFLSRFSTAKPDQDNQSLLKFNQIRSLVLKYHMESSTNVIAYNLIEKVNIRNNYTHVEDNLFLKQLTKNKKIYIKLTATAHSKGFQQQRNGYKQTRPMSSVIFGITNKDDEHFGWSSHDHNRPWRKYSLLMVRKYKQRVTVSKFSDPEYDLIIQEIPYSSTFPSVYMILTTDNISFYIYDSIKKYYILVKTSPRTATDDNCNDILCIQGLSCKSNDDLEVKIEQQSDTLIEKMKAKNKIKFVDNVWTIGEQFIEPSDKCKYKIVTVFANEYNHGNRLGVVKNLDSKEYKLLWLTD